MPTSNYTVDPREFSSGEWEEMVSAANSVVEVFVPWHMETRHKAKPLRRGRGAVERARDACLARAKQVRKIHRDRAWTADLERAAEVLSGVLERDKPVKVGLCTVHGIQCTADGSAAVICAECMKTPEGRSRV